MHLAEVQVLVSRIDFFTCLCTGYQNCFSGAQHSRSGGWDPNAEGKQLTKHRGPRGGNQTDGGLQEPLQVYENQGRGHVHADSEGILCFNQCFFCSFYVQCRWPLQTNLAEHIKGLEGDSMDVLYYTQTTTKKQITCSEKIKSQAAYYYS